VAVLRARRAINVSKPNPDRSIAHVPGSGTATANACAPKPPSWKAAVDAVPLMMLSIHELKEDTRVQPPTSP
jgi:hypothetical protein